MATPLYLIIEKTVEDAWVKIEREQITPWTFMTAGPKFQVTDFYGRTISYQGILFEGSPRQVFWGRYIEPFLENLVGKVINETLRVAAEKKQDAGLCLPEAAGLLKSVARRAFARMAEIDRSLRGKGYPQSVPLRETASELGAVEEFIDRRIAAEIAMIRPRFKVNEFYNEHPFLFWFIALLVGAAVSFAAS